MGQPTLVRWLHWKHLTSTVMVRGLTMRVHWKHLTSTVMVRGLTRRLHEKHLTSTVMVRAAHQAPSDALYQHLPRGLKMGAPHDLEIHLSNSSFPYQRDHQTWTDLPDSVFQCRASDSLTAPLEALYRHRDGARAHQTAP